MHLMTPDLTARKELQDPAPSSASVLGARRLLRAGSGRRLPRYDRLTADVERLPLCRLGREIGLLLARCCCPFRLRSGGTSCRNCPLQKK